MTNNFCVSMTSIPPRFSTLEKTLNSIDQQEIKPKKIFLNIPKSFKRFPTIEYDFSFLLNKFKNLTINNCEDFGPGTKLLGSLNEILNFDFVVLVDDDHVYNKQMLQIFNDQSNNNTSLSYSFCVYEIMDCKIGQGADGFLIKTKYLKDIKKFYKKYVINNEKLFFNDDLWISIYLNKILKVDIVSVASYVKVPFFLKFKSIYKKHTQLGAIIETYSSNRKKARELKFKENCNEYLMLKNKTNNFKDI